MERPVHHNAELLLPQHQACATSALPLATSALTLCYLDPDPKQPQTQRAMRRAKGPTSKLTTPHSPCHTPSLTLNPVTCRRPHLCVGQVVHHAAGRAHQHMRPLTQRDCLHKNSVYHAEQATNTMD